MGTSRHLAPHGRVHLGSSHVELGLILEITVHWLKSKCRTVVLYRVGIKGNVRKMSF